MSIATRATAAYRLTQQQRGHLSPEDGVAADTARVVGQLASLLGVDPRLVRPERARDRRSLPLEPLILHVVDPDEAPLGYTFSYLDPSYDDESFFLLDPCPLCAAAVPLAEIRGLADLGAYLATGPEPLPADGGMPPDSYPDAFDEHPAHTPSCPYRETRQVGLMRRGQCLEALVLDRERGPRESGERAPGARVEVPLEQRLPWHSGSALLLPSRA
ncbi:hypothetical protein [Streptacidiphilus sp. P02-A3a]|uniref:hypothetical protein n=1 Tax=Streptacidiphilus sp. P02-A3a TaxID=2704468 RepID=UPI0015F96CEB|nr:hypothetical protein [Streptacidiphilus sp. P02-A3a]QMU69495.1 hypothetical protein GXP74_15875 [Streptacidiphilus sp. P02-A3a]